jgi:hypothetical protein
MTTSELISWWYPIVIWGLLLGGALREAQRLAGNRGPRWLPSIAVLVVFVPMEGLPAGRWLHGVTATFSIPMAALLTHAVVSPLLRRPILNARAERQIWIFGTVVGLCLYPAALGWGAIDPYAWGWRDWGLSAWLALPTALLLWQGNRLGYVLLAAAAAWQVGILESNNAWDYVVDPLFALLGWIKVLPALIKYLAAGRRTVKANTEAPSTPLQKAA